MLWLEIDTVNCFANDASVMLQRWQQDSLFVCSHHGKELSVRSLHCLTNGWVLAQQMRQLSFDDTLMEEE